MNNTFLLTLNNFFFFSQNKHLKKQNNHQKKELEKLGELFENCGKVLRPCYLQLRGQGDVPQTINIKFRQLMKKVQGIDSVTWQEDNDSGLSDGTPSSSLASLHASNSTESIPLANENRIRKKRKYSSGEEDDMCEAGKLNGTFVTGETKEHDATFEVKKSEDGVLTTGGLTNWGLNNGGLTNGGLKSGGKGSSRTYGEQVLTKGGLFHAYISAVAVDFLHALFGIVDVLRVKT